MSVFFFLIRVIRVIRGSPSSVCKVGNLSQEFRHDRNVILVKGEVVYAGSSKDLRAKPQILEQHLGV